ncbi:hypothetical protein [Halalkalibacter akibai]|uniref:Uncharacterized protein n=1 Tax=Halalkalibacter akibai (strain ATCC 43226 / DSM 21942 / CIP 109018 / JCM 9157 / 1139) TaxID=1236973 RepID=W4R205_HALA3|nr:hypothetical protein [Halalkalibacter akibai]GAE37579.1 hypothetical protein JCM9157_4891 [Halalkalibacter akibai JCM 9157]
MNRHLVTVKKIQDLENDDYNVLIEGYDAEQERDFNEIVTVQQGGFLRGACLDPKKTPLSKGCISLIRIVVLDAIHKRNMDK